jgi:hypothetical protein
VREAGRRLRHRRQEDRVGQQGRDQLPDPGQHSQADRSGAQPADPGPAPGPPVGSQVGAFVLVRGEHEIRAAGQAGPFGRKNPVYGR